MNTSPETKPNPTPFESCVTSIERYLRDHGNRQDYDKDSDTFRTAEFESDCDALAKVVTVEARDSTITDDDEPIMYDAVYFMHPEIVGIKARLTQELPRVGRRVIYEFKVDGTVFCRTVTGAETQTEQVGPREVTLLAEQLSTLGSTTQN